jgi:hypothetical protein
MEDQVLGTEVTESVSDSVNSEGVAAPPDTEATEPITDTPEDAQQVDSIEQSKSFAKRLEERTQAKLAEERQRWEQEVQEKYGNYDQFKRMTDFFLQQSGYQSHEQLLEAIEQQELLQRAEQFGVTPEIQKRLEELEAKAKRAEELEKQNEDRQLAMQFRQHLESFASDKGIEADALESFMMEHQIPNFEIAYKAMRAEQLEQELATAKETAIKEYLESKKAPRVEGSGVTGVISEEPTTDFNEARKRALARLRAAYQQQ